jgi:hypothetical protein
MIPPFHYGGLVLLPCLFLSLLRFGALFFEYTAVLVTWGRVYTGMVWGVH